MKKKELKNLSREERDKKLSDLKIELVKANKGNAEKGGPNKKVIKRMIARILTFNNLENKSRKLSKK